MGIDYKDRQKALSVIGILRALVFVSCFGIVFVSLPFFGIMLYNKCSWYTIAIACLIDLFFFRFCWVVNDTLCETIELLKKIYHIEIFELEKQTRALVIFAIAFILSILMSMMFLMYAGVLNHDKLPSSDPNSSDSGEIRGIDY